MAKRLFRSLAVVAGLTVAAWPLGVLRSAGQGQRDSANAAETLPRTPWGHPDLQGIWTSNAVMNVPVERPKETLTAEDLARQERNEALRVQARDRGSNVVWNYDRQPTLGGSLPTSLVVDPPNGRIPLTQEAQEARDRWDPLHYGIGLTSWTDLDMWDRCITKGFPTVMVPMGHNNAYQIFQTPGHVAIYYEIIHDVRIIPLDGRPPVSERIRQYYGDSRGRWEGDTLVVDAGRFSDSTFGTLQPAGSFRGGGRSLHVVERFTRVDADTIEYEATLEDPRAFTAPWTLAVPLVKDDSYLMLEYACHEGNLGLPHILSAVRAEAARAATTETARD